MRVIAAICAMAVLAGSSAGVYAIHNHSNAIAAPEEKATISSGVSKENDIISAGGTITSSQLSDTLGLKNTAIQLKVGEVLVESGDTVTAGTQLKKSSTTASYREALFRYC